MTVRCLEQLKLPRTRGFARELVGEMIGTAIIIIFGVGVVASAKLQYPTFDTSSSFAVGDNYAQAIYINMVWGIGVSFGILASYELSGAHLNPAVTLYALLFGKFPAAKVLPYIGAQTVGAFLGALVVTLNYVCLLYTSPSPRDS